jgi:uncharacterized protein
MTTLVIIAVVFFLLIGLIGTIVPALPGAGLIFSGVALHAWYFGVSSIGWPVIIVLGVTATLSLIVDYAASAYGASRFNASKYGIVGSVLGGLAGVLFLNLPGLVLGIFVGAAAGEFLFARKGAPEALRAGWGSIVGFLGGTVLKFVIGLAMIITFVAALIF